MKQDIKQPATDSPRWWGIVISALDEEKKTMSCQHLFRKVITERDAVTVAMSEIEEKWPFPQYKTIISVMPCPSPETKPDGEIPAGEIPLKPRGKRIIATIRKWRAPDI